MKSYVETAMKRQKPYNSQSAAGDIQDRKLYGNGLKRPKTI